jgi:hypothetical protein
VVSVIANHIALTTTTTVVTQTMHPTVTIKTGTIITPISTTIKVVEVITQEVVAIILSTTKEIQATMVSEQ